MQMGAGASSHSGNSFSSSVTDIIAFDEVGRDSVSLENVGFE